MGINRSGTAIGVSVFIVVICTLDVQSTDLLFAVDGNGESSRIYTARSNGNSFSNSPLVPLNISGLSSPIGIDYDYRNDIIYWTDQNTHTISRATLNGSFQEIIASSSSTPHGIVLDLEKDKVFWLAAIGGKLESAHLNGSQHVDIVAGLSVPRGITISYTRRKLFFTTVGLIPGIQTVDTDGSNPTVLVDKDVGQPSGITFDFTEQRLYWTDASLDIIVSMDPDNSADRTSIISVNPDSGVDLFPFGIAVHNEDIYFSDIISQRIYFINGSSGSLSALDEVIPLAAEIHIYTDVCNNRCQNGGICVRSFASLRCLCPFGFGGTECEFEWCAERCVNGGTCISYEDGAVCSCTQGYSGARCETRTRYPSLLFICDEEAGAIYESSADELVFHRLPFRDLRRPVAVTYSPDDDMVFWIDAELLTINSAFRNGSDPKVLHSGLRYKDLAVHILTKSLVWIAEESLGFYGTHYPWDIVYSYANIYPRNLSAVTVNPSGGFYFTEWPSGILGVNAVFNVVVEQVIPAFVSPSSVTFDRLGNRLFIVDDAKNIIESFDAFGGDHDVIVHSNNTHPVDVAWYRGSPIWTDDFNNAIGFINVDRGLTYSITNRQHFMTPAGIHVFPGKSYIRIQGMGCMADEFSCNDSLCIPLSWRCDGIHDCSSSEDERDCKNDVPDASLLLVTDIDASAIYMATTNNLSFTRLPFEDVGSPVAVDFDPVEGFVFWTDVDAGRINAAKIDGTNQMLIVQGLGTPDGLFVDVQNRTLYWTDTFFNIIEAIHFSGSYRRTLVRALDEPRAIIILQSTRMLYWTDWGASPKIEMSNLSGQKRQTIVDTELGWPNGITTNAEETRIFWCDALLDKIESSDIYGKDRKLLLDVRHGTIHPFDIVWHMGSLMWTDWGLHGIGVDDAEEGRWPPNFLVTHRFSRPGGFHLYDDVCDPNPCTNNAFCIRDDFSHKYTCLCLDGWYGDNCGYGYCEENPNPCQSGGSCTSQQTAPFYMCSCAQGYFGSICENDACDPNPCLNGGSCNGDVSTDRYTCHCADGWNGQNCSNCPSPIDSVETNSDSYNHVRVMWSEPYSPCGAPDYNVTRTLVIRDQCDGSAPREMIWSLTESTSIEYNDLYAYSSYEITILPIVRGHAAEKMNLVYFTSLEDVPSQPPENVMVNDSIHNQLLCSWTALPCGSRHGKLNYTYSLGDPSGAQAAISGSQEETEVLIEHLPHYTIYRFEVCAGTSIGKGPCSKILAETLPSEPTTAQNVSSKFVNQTSALITWIEPERVNGDILRYELELDKKTFITIADNLQVEMAYLLSGLQPSHDYFLQIRAISSGGAGPWAEHNFTTTSFALEDCDCKCKEPVVAIILGVFLLLVIMYAVIITVVVITQRWKLQESKKVERLYQELTARRKVQTSYEELEKRAYEEIQTTTLNTTDIHPAYINLDGPESSSNPLPPEASEQNSNYEEL